MGLFDGSIGAFVVGTFLSMFLAGVTCTQVFYYFVTFWPGDKRLWMLLVVVLTVIDIFHSATCCYTIYLWCVTRWGDITVLVHSPWTFSIEPALTGITASIVQTFYAYRIYMVGGRSPYLPALILTLSLVQCGFAVGGTAEIFLLHGEFARFHVWTYGVLTWLLSSAVCDVIVTFSLVYHLRQSSGNNYQRTNSVVATILRQTIETNGLTMTIAIIDAALFAALPQESYHVVPQFCLIKLYFNSLLVSLNSREALAQRLNFHDASGLSGESGSSTQKPKSRRRTSEPFRSAIRMNSPPVPAAIHISMQEFVQSDSASTKDSEIPFSGTNVLPHRPPRTTRGLLDDVERLAEQDARHTTNTDW